MGQRPFWHRHWRERGLKFLQQEDILFSILCASVQVIHTIVTIHIPQSYPACGVNAYSGGIDRANPSG